MQKVSTKDGMIAHTLWLKQKNNRAILHLINHDHTDDGIVQKKDFEVSVPITNVSSAVPASPDFDGESEVSIQAHSNESVLQIPRLDFL